MCKLFYSSSCTCWDWTRYEWGWLPYIRWCTHTCDSDMVWFTSFAAVSSLLSCSDNFLFTLRVLYTGTMKPRCIIPTCWWFLHPQALIFCMHNEIYGTNQTKKVTTCCDESLPSADEGSLRPWCKYWSWLVALIITHLCCNARPFDHYVHVALLCSWRMWHTRVVMSVTFTSDTHNTDHYIFMSFFFGTNYYSNVTRNKTFNSWQEISCHGLLWQVKTFM